MKRTIYLFSFILVACIFTSCWEFASKTTYVYMDEETKEYCLFEDGTYWVYQDSATLECDSIYIYEERNNQALFPNSRFGKSGTVYEEHRMFGYLIIKPSDSLYKCSIWTTTAETLNDSVSYPVIVEVAIDRYDNDEYIGNFYYMTLYHNKNVDDIYMGVNLCNQLNVMTIANHDFTNVKQFSDENGRIWYIAKNVGLIRIEVYDGEQKIVKKLIRYNIVQRNQNN